MEEKKRPLFKSFTVKDSNDESRWYVDLGKEARESMDADLKRQGMVKIKYKLEDLTAFYWANGADYMDVSGKPTKKIEAILDYFGFKEWLALLRDELGLEQTDALRDLHKILQNEETREKYKKLRDQYAIMAKEGLEQRGLM